jgi:hypothetical protein
MKQIKYTTEEIGYRDYLIRKFETANTVRGESYSELDDMDYQTYYESNAKAGNSYVRPKKNAQDTRIVTGTTLEKENTLLSAILNYNFSPNIEAFDKNNYPVMRLGENMTDMVNKSYEMEEYDAKRPLIYKEALDQGTWYVEEIYTESWANNKKVKGLTWSEGISPSKI